MTYNLKKEYLKTWDLQQINENPLSNIENDDELDIYISERSSIASSNDMNQTFSPIGKLLPTPTTSSNVSIPQKQGYNLRHSYNDLPENGIPIATQFQLQQKKETKTKKDLRKAPPAQANLVPSHETKPPELNDNHYLYGHYPKVNNPDWIMRHRQTTDGQTIPYESSDSSQQTHQPALTTSSIKPRQQPRKARDNNHVPIIQSKQDKQRVDHSENNSIISTHMTSHENHENNYQKQGLSPRQNISFKDSDHDEHRIQPTKRTKPQQRRRLKTENDWTDHYLQSVSNGKPSQDSNSLIITSNALTNRSKHRSKISDKNSVTSDTDGNNKQRHQYPHHYQQHQNQTQSNNSFLIPSQQIHYHPHHHHSPQHQNQTQSHNSPSIPSQQTHYQHHHLQQQHLHVRRRPPSGTYLSPDFQFVDVSFKKPERPSYTQQARDHFHPPISSIYNQTPHLPPIMRDHCQQKMQTPRFPNEYYGTLARQTHGKDWEEPMDVPKIYKPDSQTRFYDRYLHNITEKRLAA